MKQIRSTNVRLIMYERSEKSTKHKADHVCEFQCINMKCTQINDRSPEVVFAKQKQAKTEEGCHTV